MSDNQLHILATQPVCERRGKLLTFRESKLFWQDQDHVAN